MKIEELEARLSELSRPEKAEVLQRLAHEVANVWPGIDQAEGVAGGAACIVRTRIPVWLLENYRRLGWSEGRILDNYPALRAADLVHARAYADAHREEVERAITEHEAA